MIVIHYYLSLLVIIHYCYPLLYCIIHYYPTIIIMDHYLMIALQTMIYIYIYIYKYVLHSYPIKPHNIYIYMYIYPYPIIYDPSIPMKPDISIRLPRSPRHAISFTSMAEFLVPSRSAGSAWSWCYPEMVTF